VAYVHAGIVQHQVTDIDEVSVEDQGAHRLGHVAAQLPTGGQTGGLEAASNRRVLIVMGSSRPAMISHGSSGRS
jgi:hypothetical protein